MACCRILQSRVNLLKEILLKRHLATSRCFSNVRETVQSKDSQAKYPPIVDTSFKAKKEREVQKWHKLIQELPTVEEKQLELNLAKYYGHWTFYLSSHDVRYNHAEFVEFVTRTNIVESWPEAYAELDSEVNKYLPLFKQKVEDILILELTQRSRHDREGLRLEKETSDDIIWAINSALVNLICDDVHHIGDSQSDLSPRLEAFWWLHGIPADDAQRRLRRRSRHNTEQDVEAPVSRPIQYLGRPALQVRARLPLPPLAPPGHPAARQAAPLPENAREPRARNCRHGHRHGTNIPGVWPDDPRQFSVATWLTREQLMPHAAQYGQHAAEDRPDALRAQGCLASFASSLAQACNLGFSPLTELTYPLTSQTIVTNGRLWSFFVYQLNTTAALTALPEEGAPGNVCYATPEMALYDSVTETGVEGLNENVLKKILQLYLLKTTDRDGINLRPYLDNANSLDSLEDDWLRRKYRDTYFRVMSNRPRHRLKDEVYLWERIYKVLFQTRPQEANKRFFELRKYPGDRRLDDFKPAYVPKAIRPDVPARERAAAKFERNVFHEMALLRGNRSRDPRFMQELQELESWRKE